MLQGLRDSGSFLLQLPCCFLFSVLSSIAIVLPQKIVNLLKEYAIVVAIICIVLLLPIHLLEGDFVKIYYSQLVGMPLILSISELLSKFSSIVWLGSKISYASLNMYLFHRFLFLFSIFVYNIGVNVSLKEATIPIWFAILLCPIIICTCYYIQFVYDKLVK